MITKDHALEILSRNVERAMVQHGLGVRELARRTGDSAMSISRVIRAKQMPSGDMLHRIAEAMSISIDSLFTDTSIRAK